LININNKRKDFARKLFRKNKKNCCQLIFNFELQLSNFRFCKQQKIIKDNNNNLLEEFFCLDKLVYSDDNKRDQRDY